jgi:hypothetical protein
MFMLAALASASMRSIVAAVTREGKLSNGIRLAPLAKTGTPLTLKPNAPSARISSTVRRPTVRAAACPDPAPSTIRAATL